jgi:hypothetical protein
MAESFEEIHARQRQLEREAREEEQARVATWEASRRDGPGVTPGVTRERLARFVETAHEELCDFVPTPEMRGEGFVVKDSGAREEFTSGMVRDTEDGKPDFTLVRKGPMFRRWAEHLTKGAIKYGRNNWTLANGEEEYERFKRSAARHFEQWLAGERDEDHAAAVMFNMNAAEYVLEQLS